MIEVFLRSPSDSKTGPSDSKTGPESGVDEWGREGGSKAELMSGRGRLNGFLSRSTAAVSGPWSQAGARR